MRSEPTTVPYPAPAGRAADVLLTVELTSVQAYALAEMCKRLTWTDARTMAVDDDEARAIINATDRVRGHLELVGVVVR